MHMRKFMMIIMAVALVALPTMAQDWQSTSAMQGSGSAYSAQVTAVGAVEATDMATTTTDTYSPAQAPSGPRRIVTPGNSGTQQPIGDALIPLLLMVMVYATYLLLRRRKSRV